MLSLRERIVHYLSPKSISLLTREYLAAVLQEENPDVSVNRVSAESAIFVNGRTIMTDDLARTIKKGKGDCLFTAGGQYVAARLSGANLTAFGQSGGSMDLSGLGSIPTSEVDAVLVTYPWDLVYANDTELVRDFSVLTRKTKGVAKDALIHKTAVFVNKKNIHVGKKSMIGAGVVVDAAEGPVYIGSNATILPTSFIEGPCFIGDGAMIKAGAKIYGNTSIGPGCKVGGEVGHSILHAHANKQHDGFLGHSYLAPWVNLGAGTTTSNLKNTYGSVKVHINGKSVDSGKMFVGLTAGDHVKVGINGTLDTGTVIGPSSNMYGTSIPPKYIAPFSWGSSGSISTYDVDRALAVAITVMGRRNVTTSEAYKQLFRHIYDITSNERTNSRT